MTGTPFLFSLMAPQGGGSAGLSILLFQIVAIGLVFYFLVIRPQGQARKKHAEMLAALAFVAICFLQVPFPLNVVAAGVIGFLVAQRAPGRLGLSAAPVATLAGLDQARGEFVEDRKRARVDDLAAADRAKLLKLLREYAGRRIVGLRREIDHEALGTRSTVPGRAPVSLPSR